MCSIVLFKIFDLYSCCLDIQCDITKYVSSLIMIYLKFKSYIRDILSHDCSMFFKDIFTFPNSFNPLHSQTFFWHLVFLPNFYPYFYSFWKYIVLIVTLIVIYEFWIIIIFEFILKNVSLLPISKNRYYKQKNNFFCPLKANRVWKVIFNHHHNYSYIKISIKITRC